MVWHLRLALSSVSIFEESIHIIVISNLSYEWWIDKELHQAQGFMILISFYIIKFTFRKLVYHVTPWLYTFLETVWLNKTLIVHYKPHPHIFYTRLIVTLYWKTLFFVLLYFYLVKTDSLFLMSHHDFSLFGKRYRFTFFIIKLSNLNGFWIFKRRIVHYGFKYLLQLKSSLF